MANEEILVINGGDFVGGVKYSEVIVFTGWIPGQARNDRTEGAPFDRLRVIWV